MSSRMNYPSQMMSSKLSQPRLFRTKSLPLSSPPLLKKQLRRSKSLSSKKRSQLSKRRQNPEFTKPQLRRSLRARMLSLRSLRRLMEDLSCLISSTMHATLARSLLQILRLSWISTQMCSSTTLTSRYSSIGPLSKS